ncbi:serine protease [Nonomuraea sp. NPDC003709]|uniref:S1 family peptidase n=1 Tax=Nonomuraea sp. NPDC003709 TaxID=3154450 RepID=UPI0033B24ADC
MNEISAAIGKQFNEPLLFLGRILDGTGRRTGTCFQVADGYLVTAYHVIESASEGDSVQYESMDGHMRSVAFLERFDSEHDIAVLKTHTKFARNVPFLALSDAQRPDTPIHLTGFAEIPDATRPSGYAEYDFRRTTGTWEGVARESPSGVLMAQARADGTAVGMSGCPVLRTSDGAVVGILSNRYNTDSAWSAGRISIGRIEDLEPLLPKDLSVAIERSSPYTDSDRQKWLQEAKFDRSKCQADPYFIQPDEWEKKWAEGVSALARGDVIIVTALPGVGATTFAEQLLARSTDTELQMARLEPGDWDEPSSEALPRRSKRAYILDLSDPEHDRPSIAFIQDLSNVAEEYLALQSRLIITISSDLWRGRGIRQIPHLCVINIDTSPNPRRLAEHYLSLRDEKLREEIRWDDLSSYLEGMSAVQTLEAVDTILSTYKSYTDGDTEPIHKRITEALDNHADTLDLLFSDPARDRTRDQVPSRRDKLDDLLPLSLEDRCLLIALAIRGVARLSQFEMESKRLQDIVGGVSSPASNTATPGDILAGPGLRGRIRYIDARVDAHEVIRMKRPSLGPATIRYVWDNYAAIRESIADWMTSQASEDDEWKTIARDWLSSLVRRHQDVDFIKGSLAKVAHQHKQRNILADVLRDAALDPHMQRRCERLLYDWAWQVDRQRTVLSVCARLLRTDRKSIALIRLKRVADAPKLSAGAQEGLLEIFREVARDDELQKWFLNAIRSWFPKTAAATIPKSAKLAFAAAMDTEVEGEPWLLSNDARGSDVDRMLGEVISELTEIHGADKSLAALVVRAGPDDDLYHALIRRIAAAAMTYGLLQSIFNLSYRLNEAGAKVGRNPIRDIDAVIRTEHQVAVSRRDQSIPPTVAQ